MLTDFGSNEIYAPIMEGVIKSINQNCCVVNYFNDVEPQNIKQAAFILNKGYKYFPKDTTFLCVVDPDVGTDRIPIAIRTKNYYFVAPNNGLLTYIIKNEEILEAIELNKDKYLREDISNTFHGRDIFAPVAGYIDSGIEFNKVGDPIEINALKTIEVFPEIENNVINGEIFHIDRFGNVISNIHKSDLEEKNSTFIEINEINFDKIRNTFSEVDINKPIAYFGSTGYLEFAIRNGNFAKEYEIKFSDQVKITFGTKLP